MTKAKPTAPATWVKDAPEFKVVGHFDPSIIKPKRKIDPDKATNGKRPA